MPASNRPDLERLASRQFGVFSRGQGRDCRVTDRAMRRWVEAGQTELVHPTTYRFASAPPMVESSWMAAALHIGEPAILAGTTAALVHGLPVPSDEVVHLIDDGRSFEDRPGIRVHRSEQLNPWDRDVRRGLPVTSVARTICDLAREIHPERLRRVVAHAIRSRQTTPDEVRRTMAWIGSFRGCVALRQILDELSPLIVTTRNELEGQFLAITTRAGIPPTAMNHPVVDADGRQRFIDAVYLPHMVPVELDGRISHEGLLDWNDDTRRENAITLVGWRTFRRFTWADVTQRPGAVVTDIRRALAAAEAAA